jgi:hypothetical protein
MFTSLRRALPRLSVFVLLGLAFVHLSVPIGRTFGAIAAPIIFNVGILCLAVAAGDAVMRMLLPKLDAQAIAIAAVGAGGSCDLARAVVFLAHCLLRVGFLLLFAAAAHAGEPPAAALAYLPTLKAEQRAHWPGMTQPSVLAAQVEQESRWNPKAQLRTSREQGITFGQFTRTWRADGSLRFDALTEIVRAHPKELAGLSWEHHDDAALQLRALVLKDRDGFHQVHGAADFANAIAFTLAGYNGGDGAVRSDRVMCEATDGCDASRWFGNVERTSMKARQAVQGYGKSFFEINREYVRNILLVRRARYLALDA